MRLRLLIIVALAAGLLAVASAPSADHGRFAYRGVVTHVVDGDTVDVRLTSGRRERVRLIGIDTPEVRPAECFGAQARTRAGRLAQGKRVRLIGDATQDTRDRYRRLLAYVVLPSGGDLGRRLIAEGFGTVFVYRRPFQRVSSYRTAERAAKSGVRGLWRACAPAAGPPPPPSRGGCHVSYPDVCIPPAPPDLDCGEIPHRRFRVRHDVPDPDPHGFDGDKDGIGCES